MLPYNLPSNSLTPQNDTCSWLKKCLSRSRAWLWLTVMLSMGCLSSESTVEYNRFFPPLRVDPRFLNMYSCLYTFICLHICVCLYIMPLLAYLCAHTCARMYKNNIYAYSYVCVYTQHVRMYNYLKLASYQGRKKYFWVKTILRKISVTTLEFSPAEDLVQWLCLWLNNVGIGRFGSHVLKQHQ